MTVHATPDPTTTSHLLDLAAVALGLDVANKARERQLAALATDPADEVAVLHRESVELLLGEIRAACRRLEEAATAPARAARGRSRRDAWSCGPGRRPAPAAPRAD